MNWLTYFTILFAITTVIQIDGLYYPFDAPKWLLLDLGLSIYLISHLTTLKIHISWFSIIIGIAICLMIGSLFWASNVYAGIEFTLRFILYVLTCACLIQNYSSRQLSSLLTQTCFAAALLFCCVYFIDRYFDVPQKVGSYTPLGFINNAGHVFNIWIPFLLLYAIENRKNTLRLVTCIGILVAISFILMAVATRTTIIALTLSEIIIFFITFYKNKKQAILFLSISSMMITGIVLFKYSEHLSDGRLKAKLMNLQSQLSSINSRVKIFNNSWDMLQENPFGVGINNFEYIHPKYAKINTKAASPLVSEHSILRTPHNFLVKMFTEIGYLGGIIFLTLFIYFWGIALWIAFIGTLTDKITFIALSASFIHAQTSAVFLTPVSFAFSMLVFSQLRSRVAMLKNSSIKPTMPLPKMFVIIVIIAPMLSIISIFSQYYAYKGHLKLDITYLEKAVTFNPGNDRAWASMSFIQSSILNDNITGLYAIDKFLTLYPEHIGGQINKARILINLEQHQQAQQLLIRIGIKHPHLKTVQKLL